MSHVFAVRVLNEAASLLVEPQIHVRKRLWHLYWLHAHRRLFEQTAKCSVLCRYWRMYEGALIVQQQQHVAPVLRTVLHDEMKHARDGCCLLVDVIRMTE